MSSLSDLKQLAIDLSTELSEKDEDLNNLKEDLQRSREGAGENADIVAAQHAIEKMQNISIIAQKIITVDLEKPIKGIVLGLKTLTELLKENPKISGVNSILTANLYQSYLEIFSKSGLENITLNFLIRTFLSNDDIAVIDNFKKAITNTKNQITNLDEQINEYKDTLISLTTPPIVEATATSVLGNNLEEQNLSRLSIAELVPTRASISVTNATLIDDAMSLEDLQKKVQNCDQRLLEINKILHNIQVEQQELNKQQTILEQEKASLKDPNNLSPEKIEIKIRQNQLEVLFKLVTNSPQNPDDNLLTMLNTITAHDENSLQTLMNTEYFKYFSEDFKTAIQSSFLQATPDYIDTCLQAEGERLTQAETVFLKEEAQKEQSLETEIREITNKETSNNYQINTLLNEIKVLKTEKAKLEEEIFPLLPKHVQDNKKLDKLFSETQGINDRLLKLNENERATLLSEKKENLEKIDVLISQIRQPEITNIIEKSGILKKYPELASISTDTADEKNKRIRDKLDNIVIREQETIPQTLILFLRNELQRSPLLNLLNHGKKASALNKLIEEIENGAVVDSAFLKRTEEVLGQKRNPFKPESSYPTQGQKNFEKIRNNLENKVKNQELAKEVLTQVSKKIEQIDVSKETSREIDNFQITKEKENLPLNKQVQSIETMLNSDTNTDNKSIKEQLYFMQNLNEKFTPNNNLSLLDLVGKKENSPLLEKTKEFIGEFYQEQYNMFNPQSEQKAQRNMDICIKPNIVPQISDLREKIDEHIGKITPNTLKSYQEKEMSGKILAYSNLITVITVFAENPDDTEAKNIAEMFSNYQSLTQSSEIPAVIRQSMESLLETTKNYIKKNAPEWHEAIEGANNANIDYNRPSM